MASPTVSAATSVEGANAIHNGPCTHELPAEIKPPPRARMAVTALLALAAFLACASVHHVAQANSRDVTSDGEAVQSDEGEKHLAAPEPARCRPSSDIPAGCELKAVEPADEDTEEDARLEALAASPSVAFAPLLPSAGQTSQPLSVAAPAQFSTCQALPRGPPPTRR